MRMRWGSLLIALCAVLTEPVCAQSWPSQSIKLIVGYTPGTGIDIIARSVGQKLSDRLGQPVIVENKAGASGNIGSELVARAKPDGHTLLVAPGTFVMVPSLYKSLPFDTVKDFTPISLSAWGQLMLCVPNSKSRSNATLRGGRASSARRRSRRSSLPDSTRNAVW